ncbi:maleylpyruvate isomerase family mycothiol-dependent enzyme [Rhodococcus phenolicus]|uniref:maleylpyruvate isomerase family mycothiol-dependent enzyme n=1 Tax=Rhodococcus phenolicus TaxID=263849 RepID=UPI0008368B66|nr:maleylpyruvate isomerase family mycothiol-dependent enzyme [Rhodococcus phenolicus]
MAAPTSTESTRRPRRPVMRRDVAMRLAATEYGRFADLLDRLPPGAWSLPTECPGWDVRAMAGHAYGMTRMAASLLEMRRQLAAAKRSDGSFIDALTEHQVEKYATLDSGRLGAAYRASGAKAARARARTPSFVRSRTMKPAQTVGGADEWWTIGYLLDIVLTRDPWMHRVDICRATGQSMVLTPEHDGVLVADVVDEWAGRHNRPIDLTLTGPAGGRWRTESGADPIELDAVEFCRILSGRAPGTGLLEVQVPF